MQEFLNPKSMLTPGLAGGVVVLLVNGLSTPFPELPQRYIALAVSFLLGGLVVVKAARMKVAERLLYWITNSLVIFTVGFGSNTLAREATGGPSGAPTTGLLSVVVPRAYAQEPKPTAHETVEPKAEVRSDKTEAEDPAKLKAQVEALKAQNAKLLELKNQDEAKKDEAKKTEQGRFFKKW